MRTSWEAFQAGEESVSAVRQEILTSWRRSRLSGVDPQRVDLPYAEPDAGTRFARTAVPVLTRLADLLVGADTCLAITDPAGRVLWRWVSDPALRRDLDQMAVVEGFVFGEEHAGTNGLGTALESRRAVMVRGDEHFKEPFHAFTCVAAPVLHPLTRRVVGAVNITCRAAATNERLGPALLALVREVQEALLHAAGTRERRLFDEFLTAARGGAPTITLGPEVLIQNEAAAALRIDHRRLWSQVLAAVEDGGPISLPELDERTAELRLVAEGPRTTGAVLVLDPAPVEEHRPAGEPSGTTAERVGALVGRLLDEPGAVVVRGEAGTGKRHLLAAALAARDGDPLVLDAAALPPEGVAAWAGPLRTASSVLLVHLDRLAAAAAGALPALLAGARGPVAATVTTAGPPAPGDGAHLTRLLDALDATVVELPPLRLRPEEVEGLVAALAPHGTRWTPQALAALEDHPWPGNLAELRLVVRAAVAAAAGRPVAIGHLPAALRPPAGARRLGPLERAEAAVIGEVLAATGGNKAAAARRLGLSRPTLYAKLRAYRM